MYVPPSTTKSHSFYNLSIHRQYLHCHTILSLTNPPPSPPPPLFLSFSDLPNHFHIRWLQPLALSRECENCCYLSHCTTRSKIAPDYASRETVMWLSSTSFPNHFLTVPSRVPLEKSVQFVFNGFQNGGTAYREFQVLGVPEPSALSLLAFGLGALAMLRRHRS